MNRVIFYSWQSDLPNSTNRSFIERALTEAVNGIGADDSIEVKPVIERDTQGVAGAPDISATIFSKIDTSDVFVADVSIIVRPRKGRPTPNPNVLIELGYAMHALGSERVVLVFNKTSGKVENLPFDLRMRRVIQYEVREVAKDKSAERGRLRGVLESAIRAALDHVPQADPLPPSPIEVANASVEEGAARRVISVRKAMAHLWADIASKKPRSFLDGGTSEQLLDAIDQTKGIAAEFVHFAETVAAVNDTEAANEVSRSFGFALERYDLPQGFVGPFDQRDFDFFKFHGHELFTAFVAVLLRENRWDAIAGLLIDPISVRYWRSSDGPSQVRWHELSSGLYSLHELNEKRHRICFHADVLRARYTSDELSGVLAHEDFMAADYLLYLTCELGRDVESDVYVAWAPWSTIFFKTQALFQRLERVSHAEQAAKAIGVDSFEELRHGVLKSRGRLSRIFGIHDGPFINEDDVMRIGSVLR
jgi:hypothetical protein